MAHKPARALRPGDVVRVGEGRSADIRQVEEVRSGAKFGTIEITLDTGRGLTVGNARMFEVLRNVGRSRRRGSDRRRGPLTIEQELERRRRAARAQGRDSFGRFG